MQRIKNCEPFCRELPVIRKKNLSRSSPRTRLANSATDDLDFNFNLRHVPFISSNTLCRVRAQHVARHQVKGRNIWGENKPKMLTTMTSLRCRRQLPVQALSETRHYSLQRNRTAKSSVSNLGRTWIIYPGFCIAIKMTILLRKTSAGSTLRLISPKCY